MSRVYDSWEKLVGAVLDREELRRLALCDSFSSSIYSDFSFDSAAASSRQSNSSSRESNFSCRVVRPIELKEIIKATSNFQNDMLIGQGVLCQAFKAWIDEHTLIASEPGSGMAVAVKRWYNNLERHQDWLKEIDYLVQLHHPNLVDLLGYCTDEGNMILVYEFMSEGNLEQHLFTNSHHQSLPWATRIKVALDIARGLSYLHDREIPIIHRDFKSSNIFLDVELNAKLSNYCYGTDDHSPVLTGQVFTKFGYTAPEYTSKGQLSAKSNVYAYGAVLSELLSGIPASNVKRVRPYFSKKKKVLEIMDKRLEGQYSDDAAYEFAKLALKCQSLDPKSRPTMADVLLALQHLPRP
ncbi:hypothetical protein C2S52_015164 [Perilla frutescens var. hirtella]|nr:hypothetical protein C2S52_015164 [Perilla frutescens var. hirtella]